MKTPVNKDTPLNLQLQEAVAARERAERELRLFRALIDQSNDSFLVIDPLTARFLDVNEKACLDLGYTREEMLALRVYDVATTVTEETWMQVSQLNREKGSRIFESSHVRKNGTTFPIEVNIKWVQLERDYLVAIVRDISDRKHIELALQRSREEFKDLFDHAPVGYHEVDAQSRLVRINETELRMLNYTEEELLGQPVWKISAEEELSRHALQMKLGGQSPPQAFERRLRRKDGSTFPALIEDRLLKGPDGKVIGIRGIIQDITERKQTQQKAAREHARFRFIFDSIPVGVAWMERGNPGSRMVNAANERITGVPAQDCHRPELYRQATHPDDRGKQDALRSQMLAGEIDHYTMEKRYVHSDGEVVWVIFTVRSIRDPAYGVVQEITTMMDITERRVAETALRESEDRFRDIADNITEVFWVTDWETGNVLYLSPAYEKIWGRTRESLYQSPDSWNDPTHPDDQKRVREAFDAVAQVGAFDQVYRIARPDGSEYWIHDRGLPIRDAQGKILRLVGIAADVTKEHKLAEQIRQAQKMEAIGTLAGGIAHDFNNILASINGYTELVKMEVGEHNPKAQEFLDYISLAGARAVDLVRQILTFSRQQDQKLQPTQMQDVVVEALKLLRAMIPATIEFKPIFAPALPLILADSTMIHQVLMNLGVNAWHAMRDRKGRLEFKLESFVADAAAVAALPRLRLGRYVRLTVTDSGCGMDEVTLQRMFDPFFTTKGPGEGTGLGLSVVHGIMQSHGGVITASSQLGVGTTFHLYFPTCEGEVPKAAPPAEKIIPHKGKTILYVDDEELVARLGREMLEHLGYTVEMRTNVEDALSLVQAHPQRFDLVVTDQSMPKMKGTDFAALLLNYRPDLPIILTTGNPENLSSAGVGAMGIRALLLKPYTLASLAAAVHRVLFVEAEKQ